MAGRRHRRPVIFDSSAAFDPPMASIGAGHGAPHPFSPDIPMLGLPAAGARKILPNIEREDDMADSVYKVIELIGTSKDSWEKAAAVAVNRAGKSLRDLRVAEVVTLDLQLDAKGKIEAYRAKLKVSFKFEG
jgi:flavin-binding protein dodecin